MKVRFPRREPDGSFEIHANFAGLVDPDRCRAWCTVWVRSTTSRWNVHGEDDELSWERNFAGNLELAHANDHVSIRLRVHADASRWKDWLVHLCHDFERAFPNVTFTKFTQEGD